jgi:hypothetical protein
MTMFPVVFKTHVKRHNCVTDYVTQLVITGDFLIDVDVTLLQACQFQRGFGSNLNSNLTTWGPNTRIKRHTLVIRHFRLAYIRNAPTKYIYM